MKNWSHADARFMTVRYEDLIADTDLRVFSDMFRFLGFTADGLAWCLIMAYDNSLFSGRVNSDHVRSGKAGQWQQYFKPVHHQRFETLFDDVLERLGYES